MAVPATTTNKHGRVLKVGDNVSLRGDIVSISPQGVVTLRVEDPYITTLSGLAQIVINAYQIGN